MGHTLQSWAFQRGGYELLLPALSHHCLSVPRSPPIAHSWWAKLRIPCTVREGETGIRGAEQGGTGGNLCCQIQTFTVLLPLCPLLPFLIQEVEKVGTVEIRRQTRWAAVSASVGHMDGLALYKSDTDRAQYSNVLFSYLAMCSFPSPSSLICVLLYYDFKVHLYFQFSAI